MCSSLAGGRGRGRGGEGRGGQCMWKASSSPIEVHSFLPDSRLLGRDSDLSVSELDVLPLLDKEPMPIDLQVFEDMEEMREMARTAWMVA